MTGDKVQTPEYHDELTPGMADADAVDRMKEISAWFRHYQVAAPRLRVLRLNAFMHLRQKMTIPEISRLTDVADARLRAMEKELRSLRLEDEKRLAREEADQQRNAS